MPLPDQSSPRFGLLRPLHGTVRRPRTLCIGRMREGDENADEWAKLAAEEPRDNLYESEGALDEASEAMQNADEGAPR
jgi:hypothetical protein